MNGRLASVRDIAPPEAFLATLGGGIVCVLAGWLLVHGYLDSRMLALIGLSVGFVGMLALAPDHVLVLLIVWLAGLGLVRRILDDVSPAHRLDLLLLVGPIAIVGLSVVATARGAFQRRTVLSNTVLALTGLIVLSAFNPSQGSLYTGLAGAFLVAVPMLAFWIGRTLSDRLLARILLLVGALAFVTAVYGLIQVFSGFPSWDAAWIRRSGFNALTVYVLGNPVTALRPFSSFASPAEYAYYLAVGATVLGVLALVRRRFLVAPVVILLVVALLYESSRIVVVATLAAAALVFAAHRRLSLPLAISVAAVGLVLLPFALGAVAPSFGGSSASVLLSHQVEGLANPFNSRSSTLRGHLGLAQQGVATAFRDPLGLGIGTTNIASKRFSSTTQQLTEADPSNIAVGVGIPGLLLYVVLVVTAFIAAYSLARGRRDVLALAALGVVTVTFLQWMNGGQYAIAPLAWLLLGWIDSSWAVEKHNRLVSDGGTGAPATE